MYDGRYLETRTPQDILDKLSRCFTKYDSSDVFITLQHILELTHTMIDTLFVDNGNEFNIKFQMIRDLIDFIHSS